MQLPDGLLCFFSSFFTNIIISCVVSSAAGVREGFLALILIPAARGFRQGGGSGS